MVDRQQYIDALREFADFLEDHPKVPHPEHGTFITIRVAADDDPEEAKRRMAEIAKDGGSFRKEFYGNSFELNKKFGETRHPWDYAIHYAVATEREAVCKAVPTGEFVEQVKYDIPDEVRAEYARTEKVEKVEWVCDEPLLKP